MRRSIKSKKESLTINLFRHFSLKCLENLAAVLKNITFYLLNYQILESTVAVKPQAVV